MRIGGLLAAATLSLFAVGAAATLITALVARGERQAFAIGFLVPLLCYGGCHFLSEHDQLDPYDQGAFATTRAFQPLFQVFVKQTWYEMDTGKVLPNYDPTADPSRHGGGMFSAGLPTVTIRETPDRTTFTLVGHALVAMMLGIVGAKFAIYVRTTSLE